MQLPLFVALCVSLWGGILASAFYVHTAYAANAANRVQDNPRCPAEPTNQDKVPQVNPLLPDAVLNSEIKALDGSTFKLSDYRGKVVLVNLWATWCGPCRWDIQNLVKISREFKVKGVEMIGLTSEDPQKDAKTVKSFVRVFRIKYKIGWGDQSFALALMQGEVRNNIPQSFVISRDGRVLKRFVGFNQKETPPKMRQALEEALNEK
jgi:thiol-disulfide isomerase/thioredoxin